MLKRASAGRLKWAKCLFGEGFLDALNGLELEFSLALGCSDVFADEGSALKMKTVDDLVRHIREREGSLSKAELYRRHRTGWGCACFLWLLFALIMWWTADELVDAYQAFQDGAVGSRNVLGLMFSILSAATAVLLAFALIRQWFAGRQAIREARQKLSARPKC